MDEAIVIQDYLPVSYKSVSESEYISFLWNAFETNYANDKFQFAFFAYHMLTMAFVYFNVWQIRQHLKEDFAKAMVGFNKDTENTLLNATTPFTFSVINESGIMRFMKLVGCDNSKIGTYAKLVKDRNESAHCNGIIFYSSANALDMKISNILKLVDEIQKHSKSIIESCYCKFMESSCDPEEREYLQIEDQIKEVLIHENYFSKKDIEICSEFDISEWSNEQGYDEMVRLNNCLEQLYCGD